ncbi:MAG: CDP-alcohol phosphatidyltransferase [Dehalococcoidia bacterium]|nr:CDP-alcohol phosphatidyltransferase [Dehalococcoidia bacterium]
MKLPDAARLMSGVLPGCRGKNGIRSGTSQNMAEPDPHMNGSESENSGLPVILYFVADWPNLITLTGLCGGVLAIFFALEQNYPAAIIAMLWAVAFDWYDGVVARNLAGRSEAHRSIGAAMDSLVDLVTSGVGPAILLLSVTDFSGWAYPGALAIIMAGVLRLSYFNVYGVDSSGKIAGLTIDNSPIVVSLVFFLESFIDHSAFVSILYVAIVVMAALHVAPFRLPKAPQVFYYIFTAYVVAATVGYAVIWATD